MGDSYREEIRKNKGRKRSQAATDRQAAPGAVSVRSEAAQRQALRREYFEKPLHVRQAINKAQKSQKEMI